MSRSRCRETLLYLDLDNFKEANDRYGNAIGDELLCVFAARLRSAARDSDIIARMGGDEFAVLLRDVGTKSVATALDRLFTGLRAPVLVAGREFALKVTGGASVCARIRPLKKPTCCGCRSL